MSKTSYQRTFTACWTCRRRNVRCDNTKPHCGRCQRMQIACEGYDNRLVWVDHETGAYTPLQRRTYACHLTWKDYPAWTLDEVGHLIEACEAGACACRLHRSAVVSPFGVFARRREAKEAVAAETPPPEPSGVVVLYARDSDVESLPAQWRDRIESSLRLFHSLSPSPLAPGTHASSVESRLFHHYVSHVSFLMIPIDCGRNPWKSTYPSKAMAMVQHGRTNGSRALYHAILAQAAYNLAELKGPGRGAGDEACAMRYLGLALRELRVSLADPAEDFGSVLAALLTITIAEHVFHGAFHGWRAHLRGAISYVAQYMAQKPWLASHDTWVITQSFVLSVVLAHTVRATAWTAADDRFLDDLVGDLTARPGFAYTIGGTARIIKLVYEIQRLERRMAAAAAAAAAAENVDDDDDDELRAQADAIVQQLNTPLSAEIEFYVGQYTPGATTPAVAPAGAAVSRTPVKLHVQLFNSAVKIYFLSIVLRRRPAEVAPDVLVVLRNTMAFVATQSGNVAVWPVFVAAAEAYTPEALALARRYVQFSKALGAGSRRTIERVLAEVWAERARLAARRGCDAGEVCVDWRNVLLRLNVDLCIL